MLLALTAACVGGAALAQAPEGKAPILAISGYDPVAYFTEGRALQGLPSITHDFGDRRYFFATARNRDLFATTPERYAPQFGGLCAAGLADGRMVDANPAAFLVRDGKLYLFQGPAGVQRAEKDPSLLTKAHENYKKK